MKDSRLPKDRRELAASLRGIRRTEPDRRYARAFCRCVLINFRTGLVALPAVRPKGDRRKPLVSARPTMVTSASRPRSA